MSASGHPGAVPPDAVSAEAPAGAVSAEPPAGARGLPSTRREQAALTRWWPLAGIVGLAALLRLATLGSQSLWFDEAFTPVHVFHSSLGATLHAISQTENTPPLWYVLDWAVTRVLGRGAVDLRLLSALAGIATVPVAWAIARRLAGERAALVTAGIVAVSPLFVWYSQEARAYALFVLLSSLAILCFLRALERPTAGRLAQFALSGSLALLTHYFAVFLLAPMVLWLGWRGRRRAASLGLVLVPVLVGAALVPLVLTQASHTGTTQWIGKWALSSRLQAIPQYFLTGYSGAPLGHAIELLIALPAIAGIALGLRRGLESGERRGAAIALVLAACGVLAPIALALAGLDYLAPRNLIAAMVPVAALLAIVMAARNTGATGLLLAGLFSLGLLAVTLDVDRSARLQRGDWSGLASVLEGALPQHAVTTVHLGTAPLEYYLPALAPLPTGHTVTVREIDETGYPPLRPSPGRPPARGFALVQRSDVKGLFVYRFVSRTPVAVSAQTLSRDTIVAAGHAEVLAPAR